MNHFNVTHVFHLIPCPNNREAVVRLLNEYLRRIDDWSDCWNRKFNPSKSKTIVVSTSRIQQPFHPPLKVSGVLVKEEWSIEVLGVTLDTKLTYERHIMNTACQAR